MLRLLPLHPYAPTEVNLSIPIDSIGAIRDNHHTHLHLASRLAAGFLEKQAIGFGDCKGIEVLHVVSMVK